MSHAFVSTGLAIFQFGTLSGWTLLLIGAVLLICPIAIFLALRYLVPNRNRPKEASHRETLNKSNENKENIRRAG